MVRGHTHSGDGESLLNLDYEKIEMRLMAHERQYPEILLGQDLHRLRAAEIFGVRPDQVTAEQRAVGKHRNYLEMYTLGGGCDRGE